MTIEKPTPEELEARALADSNAVEGRLILTWFATCFDEPGNQRDLHADQEFPFIARVEDATADWNKEWLDQTWDLDGFPRPDLPEGFHFSWTDGPSYSLSGEPSTEGRHVVLPEDPELLALLESAPYDIVLDWLREHGFLPHAESP